jgi:Ser/Thr protein kinase RdoA (MazF antagonist)
LTQAGGVEAVLGFLEGRGFEGAPKALGRDGLGRQVLEFIPGVVAQASAPFGLEELGRVGQLVRGLHDVMEDFQAPAEVRWQVPVPDPEGGELICHNDLAPWNLVRDGERWVFIDWDNVGPSSRLWDLGYAATAFLPMVPKGDPSVDGPRLRALVDGYGLDLEQRRAFPERMAARTRASYELLVRGHRTGEQPWARMYDEGHGDYWGPTAAYIEAHHDTWVRALCGL